jgi:hypothetical protein
LIGLLARLTAALDAYQSPLDRQREASSVARAARALLMELALKTNFFVAPFAQPNSFAAARRFRSYHSVERRRFRHAGSSPGPREVIIKT